VDNNFFAKFEENLLAKHLKGVPAARLPLNALPHNRLCVCRYEKIVRWCKPESSSG